MSHESPNRRFGDAMEARTPIDGVKGRFPILLEDGTLWWKEDISPFIPPPLPVPAVRLAFQILFRIAVLILSQVVSIHA